MTQSVLGRTEICTLVNKSGGNVAQGDVVVVDLANAASFTTTASAGYVTTRTGVVLDPGGVASNAAGRIAFCGYVPKLNLNASASLGDFVRCHSVAKQGTPHATPNLVGDFAEVLGTGTSPAALLLGSTIQTSTGGGAFFAPTGLTGATQASRYVGATASGAPVSGTFAVGDFVLDQLGVVWVCTAAGSPGTWRNVAAGSAALVLLEQHDAAGGVGSLDFTSFISSTYDEYIFELLNVLPVTINTRLYIRMGTGGGPSWDASSLYETAGFVYVYNASAVFGNAHGSLVGQITTSNAADTDNGSNSGWRGSIHLVNPGGSVWKKIHGQLQYSNTSAAEKGVTFGAAYDSTTVVTGIRFLMDSGNIASGIIRAYGVAK